MGNAPSNPHQHPPHMSDAAAQSLSRRGQQRLSQNPYNPYVNFFEMAAATPDPVVNRRPKKKPDSRSGSTSGSSSVASSSLAGSSAASVSRTPRQSATSETATLVSQDSVQHFEYHNGRKYLSYPPSIRRYLPCDDDESDRIVIMVSGGGDKDKDGVWERKEQRKRNYTLSGDDLIILDPNLFDAWLIALFVEIRL